MYTVEYYTVLKRRMPCVRASLGPQLFENLPAVWETWV